MALYITAYTLYAFGTMRAAKIIHAKLIDSVVGATLRFVAVVLIPPELD